jgi:exosortase
LIRFPPSFMARTLSWICAVGIGKQPRVQDSCFINDVHVGGTSWEMLRISARNAHLCWQFGLLAVLLSALYHPVVVGLFKQWLEDPSYSHAFSVPIFSVLWCWMHRDVWTTRPICPSNSGIILILAALALLIVGTLGAEIFLPRVSLVVLLAGFIAYFAGWQMLRALLAPVLILFLMVPLPAIVFNEVAFPLQLLASSWSAFLLELLRVPVLREGNVMVLPSMSLDVAEACSGIRSLLSLITLAVFYGSIAERRNWLRWTLVAVAVPIAVAANALRIVGAAVLGYYLGPRFAEGFFHLFSGWLIFILALGLLVLLHKLGSRLAVCRTAT